MITWRAFIIGISAGIIVFLFSLFVANASALRAFWHTDLLSLGAKLRISITFLTPRGNISLVSYLLTLAIAVALAFLIALLVTYIRTRRTSETRIAGAAGTLGFIASLFGIGCAACGSAIVISIVGAGAGAFLGSLPLHGAEFSIAALGIIIASIGYMIHDIRKPLACEIDPVNVIE